MKKVMPFSKYVFDICMTAEENCRIPTSGDWCISEAASRRQSVGTRVSLSTKKIYQSHIHETIPGPLPRRM